MHVGSLLCINPRETSTMKAALDTSSLSSTQFPANSYANILDLCHQIYGLMDEVWNCHLPTFFNLHQHTKIICNCNSVCVFCLFFYFWGILRCSWVLPLLSPFVVQFFSHSESTYRVPAQVPTSGVVRRERRKRGRMGGLFLCKCNIKEQNEEIN